MVDQRCIGLVRDVRHTAAAAAAAAAEVATVHSRFALVLLMWIC